MRTETYICDICKQSKSKEDLAKLSISSEGLKIKNERYGLKVDICTDCLKKRGFVVDTQPSEEEQQQAFAKNRKTLEDKLIDILEDLGVAFTE